MSALTRRAAKRAAKAMTEYTARAYCGCCTVDNIRFKSEESAAKAWAAAGLGSKQTLVDDAGVKHDGIDTFYGLTKAGEQ